MGMNDMTNCGEETIACEKYGSVVPTVGLIFSFWEMHFGDSVWIGQVRTVREDGLESRNKTWCFMGSRKKCLDSCCSQRLDDKY